MVADQQAQELLGIDAIRFGPSELAGFSRRF
jgi:hypothetical protein